MSKKIVVRIKTETDTETRDIKTTSQVETIGYDGQACMDEMNNLSKVLKGAGVDMDLNSGQIKLKSAEQIMKETQEYKDLEREAEELS